MGSRGVVVSPRTSGGGEFILGAKAAIARLAFASLDVLVEPLGERRRAEGVQDRIECAVDRQNKDDDPAVQGRCYQRDP